MADKKEQVKCAIEDTLYAAGYGIGYSKQSCKNDIIKGGVLVAGGVGIGGAAAIAAKALGEVDGPVKTALTAVGCLGGLVLGMGLGDIVGASQSLKTLNKVDDKLKAALNTIDGVIEEVIAEKPTEEQQ